MLLLIQGVEAQCIHGYIELSIRITSTSDGIVDYQYVLWFDKTCRKLAGKGALSGKEFNELCSYRCALSPSYVYKASRWHLMQSSIPGPELTWGQQIFRQPKHRILSFESNDWGFWLKNAGKELLGLFDGDCAFPQNRQHKVSLWIKFNTGISRLAQAPTEKLSRRGNMIYITFTST